MRDNNKGLSLVELIVVILIIGIISGGAVMGVSAASNANADRAAREIGVLLNEAREKAVSMDNDGTTTVTAEIYLNAKEQYVVDIITDVSGSTPEIESKVIGSTMFGSKVKLYAGPKNSAEATQTLIGGGGADRVVFSYSKSTGGLKEAKTVDGTGSAISTDQYDLIIRGSKSFKLIVVPVTGRCYRAGEIS